jgi:hypothetical protein
MAEITDITVYVKGPQGVKGDTGDDAYQNWLSLGNVGTMQDFMDYLKASSTPLSSTPPVNLNTVPSAGVSTSASRSDHSHRMPTYSEVGADPAGRATSAIAAHVAAPDPHPQYTTNEELNSRVSADDLSDNLDTTKGASLVGFKRAPLSKEIETVSLALSGLVVNIWEYASLATGYDPTGVVPPSQWDWTAATAQAISDVKSFGGGTVRFPAGSYPHTRIIRRHSVSLLGDGSSSTYFTALSFNPGGTYGYLEIEDGAVSASHMTGIHVMGSAVQGFAQPNVNPTQWGMYIKAKWDAGHIHGGLWYSNHTDIRFSNFNFGVWTRGGYTNANYQRPIQFLKFYQVFIQVPTDGEALRMTGQHGQIEFIGGAAEGRDGVVALRCVSLDWDPDPSTMADDGWFGENINDLPGQGNAVQAPINVTFGAEFSMQKSQEGAFARNCRAVFFDECWFERIGKLFTLAANAKVYASKNHLANAADGGTFGAAGSGYLYSLSGNAYLSFEHNNEPYGIVDNYINPSVDFNNILGLNVKGMPSGDATGKYKPASFKTLTITGSTLDLQAHKFVVVNPAADATIKLTSLKGTAAPGEVVVIRPLNGTITLTNAGNISLNGLGSITVPQFGILTLLRIWQVGASAVEWVLVSCTEHFSTVQPVNGFYYTAGTKIWQTGPTPNNPMGWMCTSSGLAGTTASFRAMPNLAT